MGQVTRPLVALSLILIGVGSILARSTSSSKWKYVGCYKDTRPRDLTSYHKDESLFSGMTLERCYKFCSSYNTFYMAVQDGNECRCDNSYGRYGATSESKCDDKCTGDSSQICGGSFANSVYRIRDKAAVVVPSSMMKLSTSSNSLAFTALGDWGKEGSAQRAVAKALGEWSQSHGSAFTMALGDNFYEFGISSATDKRIQSTWKNVYTHKSLQHPWLVIEGNHDYLLSNAPYQVEYGERDSRWVMPSLYYSMTYTVGAQRVHFIFLDTQTLRYDADYHQVRWFENEISKSKADWIIVVGHHPVFSSGSHGSSSSTKTMYNYIRSKMVKYRAALYICGHDHDLEHMTDSGSARPLTEYIVSGSGSKTRDRSSKGTSNLREKRVTSEFFSSKYGFVGFELTGNRIKVSYIDQSGARLYSFTKTNPRSVSSSDVIG